MPLRVPRASSGPRFSVLGSGCSSLCKSLSRLDHPAFPIASIYSSATPKPPTISRRRQYHSHDHPAPSGPFNATEIAILKASIPHISSNGFTQTTLLLGARDAGFPAVSTNLFPAGPYTLVHWHCHQQRLALTEKLQGIEASLLAQRDTAAGAAASGKPLSVTSKVQALTLARLHANAPIAAHLPTALALATSPSHLRTSVHELALLADEIWYLAGDKSVDTAWYTKRGTLVAVYAACELFMSTDRSPEFSETEAFLQRRLGDVRVAGGVVRDVGGWLSFTAGAAVNVLRSKGMRI